MHCGSEAGTPLATAQTCMPHGDPKPLSCQHAENDAVVLTKKHCHVLNLLRPIPAALYTSCLAVHALC
jgi:hypothetical protein